MKVEQPKRCPQQLVAQARELEPERRPFEWQTAKARRLGISERREPAAFEKQTVKEQMSGPEQPAFA
jgi:hypothetical protein